MSFILTREQSRQLDQELIEGAGLPSVLLMENAGRGAAEVIAREFPEAQHLIVFSGVGNNGGDGFVVARRWLTLGKSVTVCLISDEHALSAESHTQLRAYQAVGGHLVPWDTRELEVALVSADLIVDAVFGTGLSRPIEGIHRQVVEKMNDAARPIVALDIPSGLDANTGRRWGACTKATATVTFGLPKRGFFTFGGAQSVGQLFTVDIGAPLPLERLQGRVAQLCSRVEAAKRVAHRTPVGHKGQAGHVVVIAGSPGTLGAARLAAHGAFRAGAGLVTVVTSEQAASALSGDVWEVMVRAVGSNYYEESTGAGSWVNRADAVVFGPGLGVSETAMGWLEGLLAQFRGVVVLDADGLTLLAERPQLRQQSPAQLVLTPHPGEAARLLGCTSRDIEADRFAAVELLASRFDAAVVLKGAHSLVAGSGETWVAPRGHDCLATAGSGDVLAGVVGALGARLAAFDAALTGSWVHAEAGARLGAGKYAARGLLAREIADVVPELVSELVAVGRAELPRRAPPVAVATS